MLVLVLTEIFFKRFWYHRLKSGEGLRDANVVLAARSPGNLAAKIRSLLVERKPGSNAKTIVRAHGSIAADRYCQSRARSTSGVANGDLHS